MKYLHAFKKFISNVLRDRNTTLEQYIRSRNPQSAFHVEQLEREYNARMQRRGMI
jgi:hypothetical protein